MNSNVDMILVKTMNTRLFSNNVLRTCSYFCVNVLNYTEDLRQDYVDELTGELPISKYTVCHT